MLARIDFQWDLPLKTIWEILKAVDQDNTKTKYDYVQFQGKVPAKAQGTKHCCDITI